MAVVCNNVLRRSSSSNNLCELGCLVYTSMPLFFVCELLDGVTALPDGQPKRSPCEERKLSPVVKGGPPISYALAVWQRLGSAPWCENRNGTHTQDRAVLVSILAGPEGRPPSLPEVESLLMILLPLSLVCLRACHQKINNVLWPTRKKVFHGEQL